MELVQRIFCLEFYKARDLKKKKKQNKLLTVANQGNSKRGRGGKKCVQRKDSFNQYLINKNGLLSAMLFLLRDGFLSSIGQQNVSVIDEHHSI